MTGVTVLPINAYAARMHLVDAIRAGRPSAEIETLLDSYDEITELDQETALREWDPEVEELANAAEDLIGGKRTKEKVERVRKALATLAPMFAEGQDQK